MDLVFLVHLAKKLTPGKEVGVDGIVSCTDQLTKLQKKVFMSCTWKGYCEVTWDVVLVLDMHLQIHHLFKYNAWLVLVVIVADKEDYS